MCLLKDAHLSVSPSVVPNNQTQTIPLFLSAEVHQEIAAARRYGKSLKDYIMTTVFERMERNS